MIRHVLERQVEQRSDQLAVSFPDGESWTYAAALEVGYRGANVLRDAGVRPGDRVSIMVPNGAAWLRAWWSITFLGAVMVPINPQLRGRLLAHALHEADSDRIVADEDTAGLATAIRPSLSVLRPDSLRDGDPDEPILNRPLEPWDLQAVYFTSGTTGPSKGVLSTYAMSHLHGRSYWSRTGPDDTILTDLPLHHIAALNTTAALLCVGGSAAIRERFKGTGYWDVVRQTGATFSILLGSMPAFLWSQPERADDADNPLRWLTSVPLPPDVDGFMRRFGIEELVSAYASTEVSTPITTHGRLVPGSCGRAWPDMHVRLVDEHDREVPVGEVGEAVFRSDIPWAITPGYLNRPEATADAWRNGWFHSGDLLRRDRDGNYWFVDRRTDSIRRRGENISSQEVEAEVVAHPMVVDAACVAHPGEYGDDEVKVFVVLADGCSLPEAQLAAWLHQQMPAFMAPRFIEYVDELPRTPTNKIRKVDLRSRPHTAATWDRQRYTTEPGVEP